MVFHSEEKKKYEDAQDNIWIKEKLSDRMKRKPT
jgi:hypothetical protein